MVFFSGEKEPDARYLSTRSLISIYNSVIGDCRELKVGLFNQVACDTKKEMASTYAKGSLD